MPQFGSKRGLARTLRMLWRQRLDLILIAAAVFFAAVFLIYIQMAHDRAALDGGGFTVVGKGGAHHRKEAFVDSKAAAAAAAAAAKKKAKQRQLTPRAAAVVDGMRHAWGGYSKYAMGADELLPLDKEGKATLGGLGASVVDAMSTLHLMGLHEEFAFARAWVASNLTFAVDTNISFFEIVIRVLGGLISAHQLTEDPLFLEKARDLGDRLLPAFDTSPTGIVDSAARLPRADKGSRSGVACLVEFGSDTLEFASLSALTGDERYRDGAEKGIRFLHSKYPDRGLLANDIERSTGAEVGNSFGIGPRGDSYYEYLLKYWILGGKQDEHWRERWERSVDDALERLVITTSNDSIAYAGELHGGGKSKILPHLACYYPGNLALGIMAGAVYGEKAAKYRDLAIKMANACVSMYLDFPLGLPPDTVDIGDDGKLRPHFNNYLQRPEVVESLFYLKRLTGDARYEDCGWTIWQSIEKWTRQEVGYSGLRDATANPPESDNIQQSWFLAETLKYFYLLFSPDDTFSLETWTLNTEAHPLRNIGASGLDEVKR